MRFALQSSEVIDRFVLKPMPLSFRFPNIEELPDEIDDAQLQRWNARCTVEDITAVIPIELTKLTKFERQRGWYIDIKPRPAGIIKDTFYVHLQSKLKVRSLIEIFYFIETGKRPTKGDTATFMAEINITDEGINKTTRGNKLVDMREVGFYDKKNKKIYQKPIVPVKSHVLTSRIAKRGNKRKKTEEEVSTKDVNDSVTENEEVYTLYDIQTLI